MKQIVVNVMSTLDKEHRLFTLTKVPYIKEKKLKINKI